MIGKSKKKNIGILFPSSKGGGVFQYALGVAESLIKYSDKFNYTIFHYKGEKPELFSPYRKNLLKYLSISQADNSLIKRTIHFIYLKFGSLNFLLERSFQKIVKKSNIEILIIPTPFSFNLPLDIPYIVSVPDYMHKYYPNFPEHRFKNIWRDAVYDYFARKSILIVADSKQGGDDVCKYSKIEKEKIRIIPYIPPNYVYQYKKINKKTIEKLLKDYKLPEKFIFYPAQFWHHKNHLRLVKALNLIKENKKIEIPLVLVGSSKGNYEKEYKKVLDLAEKLNMSQQIIHLGYVSNIEMVALYKKATALVLPTLVGPTNIPPLEAMFLGTPVACLNLFEMPNQMGDAALLFNPFEVEDISEKIYKIWTDERLRKELIRKGHKRIKDFNLKSHARKWEKVIEEALKIKNYGK